MSLFRFSLSISQTTTGNHQLYSSRQCITAITLDYPLADHNGYSQVKSGPTTTNSELSSVSSLKRSGDTTGRFKNNYREHFFSKPSSHMPIHVTHTHPYPYPRSHVNVNRLHICYGVIQESSLTLRNHLSLTLRKWFLCGSPHSPHPGKDKPSSSSSLLWE